MKNNNLLLSLSLVSSLGLVSTAAAAKVCELSISATDTMQFSTKEMKVDSSCQSFKLTLTHTGKLPKQAMGHNWVLSKKADMNEIVAASIAAGLAKNYVADDKRVIAATELVGGGGTTTIDFKNTLTPGEEYMFYCTFPGHAGIMKGTFIVAAKG